MRTSKRLISKGCEEIEMAEYNHAIVTFVDLLGFGSAVDGGKPVNDILAMLQAVREEAHEDTETKKLVKIEYMCVSDCMIRALHLDDQQKVTAPELQQEMLQLVHMQCSLILKGFPVRGAVSHGPVYFKGRTLFGPAYQKAYKLERDVAKTPRIIVDKAVIDDFIGYPEAPGNMSHGDAKAELMSQIRKDTDGQWFLDYLRSFKNEVDYEADYYDFLVAHRTLIEQGLKAFSSSPCVCKKYEWMRTYHNEVVGELKDAFFPYNGAKREDLLLPTGELSET